MATKRPWIDTHIHVSDIGCDGVRREHMLDDLLDVLERSGADLRFVISCDFPYITNMKSDSNAIRAGNEMIWDLVSRAPDRLYGSCTVNPGFLDESLKVMERCFGQWGFVQLGEMLPYIMAYRMDDAASVRLVREAVSYGVPVQVHIGTYWVRNAGPSAAAIQQLEELLNVAEQVPDAKYILAHAIGCGPTAAYVPWADMILDAIFAVFGSWPQNFWIEIRDFHCPALPRVLCEVPTDRLLAGTDWTTRKGPPFQAYGTMFDVKESDNPFPPRVESFVGFLRAAGASEESIWRIGFENARELLHLPRR
jgi:predicted TIM-barrel fold metal-dependent hydrolase